MSEAPGGTPPSQPTPPWKRALKIGELVLWLGLLGFVGHRFWPQVAAVVGVGRPGDLAPDLSFTTLDGEAMSLGDLRGSVVLVNFWATWCPPCRVEMPGFQRVWEERRDEGFVLLGLATDIGGDAGVRAFLAERGIDYPVAVVGEEAKRAFGGVPLLPTSILLDREGRIRHRVEGFFAPPALRVAVGRLLRPEDGGGDALVDADVVVRDAWVRAPAPAGPMAMTAGFLSLHNPGAAPDTLVSVSWVPASEAQARPDGPQVSIELHRTVMEGDMARMRPAGRVEIPADGALELRPGGYHLMIGGPVDLLAVGDTVWVSLELARAGTRVAALPIRTP